MAPWLRVLEAYLVQALLRTPAFHRGVEKVVKGVNRARHGIPPEELGGTKIDQPGNGGFLKHFQEEIQTQLGRAEAKGGNRIAEPGTKVHVEQNVAEGEGADAVWASTKRQTVSTGEKTVHEEGADAAWENARKRTESGAKRGFIGEYVEALREQGGRGR